MTRTELRKRQDNRMRNLENLLDIAWTAIIMGATAFCIMVLFYCIWVVAYAMSGTTL